MKRKQIVFVQTNVVELRETELSDPKAGEVQVKLAVSSVSSGTERANLSGSRSVSVMAPEEAEAVFPRYPGYSSAGVIVKVGDGVTDFKVGDRVALWWSVHASVQNIAAENVLTIGNVPFEDAALFHIATFPLATIRKCRLELGESAVVMGMGILGLLAVALLKSAGAAPIIAVDPQADKREKALACGADIALDPYDPSFADTVKQLTDGGAKVGIEVTGVGAGLNGILDCMARYGRVALLGCTRSSDFTIDYYRKVHGPGISLIGAHAAARPSADSYGGWWTQKEDMAALKKLTEHGRLQLAALVDEVHRPDECRAVYERLVTDRSFPIVQFDWRT